MSMTGIEIQIRKADRSVEIRTFTEGCYVIGRESGDIVLGDPQVSGTHGELLVEAGKVTFVDKNSTNGSYTSSGRRITGAIAMSVGDDIRMGSCDLVLTQITPPPKGETEVVPAVQQPVDPAVPVLAPDASGIPTAASPEAAPPTSPGSGGLVGDTVDLIKWAIAALRPHIVTTAMPIAVLTIPIPLVISILTVLMLLILPLAPLFLTLIGILAVIAPLVTLGVVLFVYPMIARFLIALYRSEPVTMKSAWDEYRGNLGENVLNTFVTTLIGGVTLGILGVFVFQIPPVEGKRMVDVNMRSFELFKLCWKRTLSAVIGAALLFFVPSVIINMILGVIPFVGPIASPIVTGVIMAAYVPTVLLILTRIYFETAEQAQE